MDKAYPNLDSGEFGEAEKAFGCMIVSGGDAPAFLEPVEEPLDSVAHGVDGAVDGVLELAVPLGWDLWASATRAQFASDIVGVVALVGEHDLWVGVSLGHQVVESSAVMGLTRRQDQRDWKTLSVGPGVDFGREATARAAKSLVLSPPPCAGGTVVCPDRSAVDHLDRVVAATIGQRLQHQVPQAAGGPAAVLPVHGVPIAELFGQVPPRCPGAGDPENRVQRASMVARRAATHRPSLNDKRREERPFLVA